METTGNILDSCASILSQCELCSQMELLKIGVFIVIFILGTFDIVTNWMNWKPWNSVEGFDLHYFLNIFQIAFLCTAIVGTFLWAIEVVFMIQRSWHFIRRYQSRSNTKNMKNLRNIQESEYNSSKVGFTVRLLIGLMEDLPVMILLYYAMIIPFCGVPGKQERYSPTTVATLGSSMLNSIWTMFILYWDLFGCYKKMSDIESCCIFVRNAYGPDTSLFLCYCGWCGCVNCKCVCLFPCGTQQNPSKHSGQKCGRCRRIALCVGKTILFGMIFLLYLGIFILGGMTLSNAYHNPVLDRAIIQETEVSKSVLADKIGPGLDAKPDEAMFITMLYELPNWYHIGLYDNRNVNIANSGSVHQIQNHLYIGQFKELEHLKYGTLTKAIPCYRVFPFLDKIDKSLFQWNNSQKLDMTDFSNCKVIF